MRKRIFPFLDIIFKFLRSIKILFHGDWTNLGLTRMCGQKCYHLKVLGLSAVSYQGFVKVSLTASPGHNYLSNDQSTNSSNISKVVQHSGLIMTICWISKVNNFSWPQWKACVGGWLKAGVNIVILTWCVPNGELYVCLIIFDDLLYFIKPCWIVDLEK